MTSGGNNLMIFPRVN